MNLSTPSSVAATTLSPVSHLRMSFPQPETVQKPITLKERLFQLSQKLAESHLVSVLHLQKIQQFQEMFALITPEDHPEYAADLICFLICDVLLESQATASTHQKIALQDYEKALKAHLKGLLPDEYDLEDYITLFFILTKKWESKIEEVQLVNELTHEIEKRIYQSANLCNREIIQNFEEKKERVLKINTERGLDFETVVVRREGLTMQMNTSVNQQANLMNSQGQVDDQMLKARADLETQLKRLEETIRPLEKLKR